MHNFNYELSKFRQSEILAEYDRDMQLTELKSTRPSFTTKFSLRYRLGQQLIKLGDRLAPTHTLESETVRGG